MRGIGRLCAAVVLLSCSGEPPPQPSGPPMGAPAGALERTANAAPLVERVAITPAHPRSGERVQAIVSVVDPDGDPFRLHHAWSIDGVPVRETGSTLLLPGVQKGQGIEVVVVASDGRAESPPVRATVWVGNRPPQLVGVRLEAESELQVGTALEAIVEARDRDGDPLRFRYRWSVNGKPVDTSGSRFRTEALRRGDVVVVDVVASDGTQESASVRSGEVEIGNAPPEIVSLPAGFGDAGTFRYALEVRDPDGDRNLRFRLLEAPAGMELDAILGELAWQPTVGQVGRHRVEVAVDDGHGGVMAQRFELTVKAGESTMPPAAPAR